MAEKNNSVLTIRADDEIKARFKSLAESLGNQATALESLLNAYEMQTAKDILKDRRTDIEDFDTHLQAISRAFLHSLEVTVNTTERVRAEFQRQLDGKDLTISDLKERIKLAERSEQTAKEQVTAIECVMSELREQTSNQLISLRSELDSVKKSLTTAIEQLTDKQALLDEYRKRLEKAEQGISEIPDLKEKINVSEQEKKAAEQKIERLTAELSKQKSEFESKIIVLQERADIEKEKAVLTANQEHTRDAQNQTKEIQRLYAEIDKLRQENLILNTNLAMLNAEKSKKETE
ncbi:MAG: hypothetical protein K2J39_12040 [Ruminococcus sp.]|nr:hypothetical protein [Ruminococcus sp.]